MDFVWHNFLPGLQSQGVEVAFAPGAALPPEPEPEIAGSATQSRRWGGVGGGGGGGRQEPSRDGFMFAQRWLPTSFVSSVTRTRHRADGMTTEEKLQNTGAILGGSILIIWLVEIYERIEAWVKSLFRKDQNRTADAQAQARNALAAAQAGPPTNDPESADETHFNFIAVCNIQKKVILAARGLDGTKPFQPEAKTRVKKLIVAAGKMMKPSSLKILKDSSLAIAYMTDRDMKYMTLFGGVLHKEYPSSTMEQCVMDVMSAINEQPGKDLWAEAMWEQKLGPVIQEKNLLYRDHDKVKACTGAYGNTLDMMSSLNDQMQEQTRKVQKNQHDMHQLNVATAQMSDEASSMNEIAEIARRKHELAAIKQYIQFGIMAVDALLLYNIWGS